MLYHAFSSDPEGTVPDWTYKVSCEPRIIGLTSDTAIQLVKQLFDICTDLMLTFSSPLL